MIRRPPRSTLVPYPTLFRSGRQGREARGAAGGKDAHVGAIDRDSRGERAGVGLGLGDTGALLHVGVQRDGDRRENADDRHDDEELDQREASLTAKSHALPLPVLSHVPSVGWLVGACGRRNQQETCRLSAVSIRTNELRSYTWNDVTRPTFPGGKLTN